jgi:seryl-tRNA synthetase
MHDIKAIRDNPQAFDAGLARRGLGALSAELIAIDEEKRGHQSRLQEAQAQRPVKRCGRCHEGGRQGQG